MKYIVYFFFFTTFSYAQNLTIDDLISLRNKNSNEVEENLLLEGWTLSDMSKGDEQTLQHLDFHYKKNENVVGQAFLMYMFSKDNSEKRLMLQFYSTSVYNSYISTLKKYGTKIIKTEIDDDNYIKTYQGKTLTFIVTVGSQQLDKKYPVYRIFIRDNKSFNSKK